MANICGTCDEMCPKTEVTMRTRERLLHFYEIDHTSRNRSPLPNGVVKEFSRSAAGQRAQLSSEIRTFEALQRTIEYLLAKILVDTRRPYNAVYDFIFDRFRAVRQEIVIQNLDIAKTINLLEPIICFYAYSAYRLCEQPIAVYDPKICHQHLQECLKKVLCCYDEANRSKTPGKNQGLIESIYLVLNLGDAEALRRAISLPVKNECVKQALQISMNRWTRNHFRSLKYLPDLPHLVAAVAGLEINRIRYEMLRVFAIAYHNKQLYVSLEWLANILLYDNIETLAIDCCHYGLTVSVEMQTVQFNKTQFNCTTPQIPPRHMLFIDNKLAKINVSRLLLLKQYF